MTGSVTTIKNTKPEQQRQADVIPLVMELYSSSPAPVVLINMDADRVLSVNQAFCRLTGYDPTRLETLAFSALLNQTGTFTQMKESLKTRGTYQSAESQLLGSDGQPVTVIASAHNVQQGDISVAIVILHDVSQHVDANTELQQSDERFRLALQGAEEGLWDWDILNDSFYYSARAAEILGFREGELGSGIRSVLKLVHPKDLKPVWNSIKNCLRGETDRFEIEFRARHKKGHYRHILSRGFGITRNTDNKISRIVGTHLDISGRKRTERLISANEQRFRAIYDDSPAMFFTLDRVGRIKSVNRFGAEHLGATVESLLGKSITEFIDTEHQDFFAVELEKCARIKDKVHKIEFRLIHQFDEPLWVRAAIRPIFYAKRKLFLVTCEDISEARILSEHLEHQAKYDSLTGLINRSEFERRLRQILMFTSDTSEHALCYLDLDQFKVINDTCGHLAGDEMLRRISDLLNTVVRKRDTLARLGGDEFAVLLEHCPFYKAREIAENLLDTIKTFRFEWQGNHFSPGVSIGLVPVSRDSGTLSDILSSADSACYAAKDAGRNRVHIYHVEDDELSMRRSEMQWVAEITNALEENRFQLAVQPIISLQNGGNQITGEHYEILIRMEDKKGDLIMPGSFLPAAEKYNLSGKIDQWVVDNFLGWLQDHPHQFKALDLCSINLSGLSMSSPHFREYLASKLEGNPDLARKICFEITETAAIANLGHAIKFMNTMKEMGCSFSLDDFGTGLSSFSYLKTLPVDYLKIDGAFIRNIAQDVTDQAMVRTIHELGKVMGKATVAEFVENDIIRQILTDIGVDYAQGYGVGRPVLLKDI